MTKFDLYYDDDKQSWVAMNPETGEIKDFKVDSIKSTKSTKKVKDENPNPQLTLLDNKYQLNSAAVDLMGVEPDARIDIKYEKQGKKLVPVIGTDEAFGTHGGNRLTKTYTVSYRGKNRDELARLGTVFTLAEHPTKSDLFTLNSDVDIDEPVGDENIGIPEDEEISDITNEFNLDDFIGEDNEGKVTNFDFNL